MKPWLQQSQCWWSLIDRWLHQTNLPMKLFLIPILLQTKIILHFSLTFFFKCTEKSLKRHICLRKPIHWESHPKKRTVPGKGGQVATRDASDLRSFFKRARTSPPQAEIFKEFPNEGGIFNFISFLHVSRDPYFWKKKLSRFLGWEPTLLEW